MIEKEVRAIHDPQVHPTTFYFKLQQVCNRASTMERLSHHFDLKKVLDPENATEQIDANVSVKKARLPPSKRLSARKTSVPHEE